MKVTDFIGAKATYDERGQTIWGVSKEGLYQKIGDVRGWGAIRKIFLTPDGSIDEEKAMNFQDELGKWIVDAINEKLQREANQTDVIGSDIRRYVGSICDKCGEMSNHDDIDEDICIHCKTRFGTWKHIYEPPY